MRRALAYAALLLACGAIVAAPPIRPAGPMLALADAIETSAYRISSDPTRFPIPAGQRSLRVLLNFDLASEPPFDGTPFAVRVRIPEDGRDETFQLLAHADHRADGALGAFYIGVAGTPARTRELALERPGDGSATLELTLASPETATASARVLAVERRPPLDAGLDGPAARRRLAREAGLLDWDQLSSDVQQQLLSRRFSRLPAEPGATSRRLYLAATARERPAPAASREELLQAGQVASFVARGPETLRIVAPTTGLQGELRVVTEAGRLSSRPLSLAAGDSADVSLDPGLSTVEVVAAQPAGVVASISGAPVSIGWSVETFVRAEPAPAAPVAYDLGGRDGSALKLTARAVLDPLDPPGPLALRWSILDAAGRTLEEGTLAETTAGEPRDRIERAPESIPSEPVVAYLWPPPRAHRLELTSERAVEVAVASAALENPPRRAALVEPEVTVRLRNAAQELPEWVRIRPLDEQALAKAGRLDRLELAIRLEASARPEVLEQAETFLPNGEVPRQSLLAPAPDVRAGPGSYWALRPGVEALLTADAAAGAQQRVTLLFANASTRMARVHLDGVPLPEQRIYGTRGQLALPPLGPGAHRLRVDGLPGARLFVDARIAGAEPYRSYGVHELGAGAPLRVAIPDRRLSRSLGMVLYFDAPPGEDAAVVARIHAGGRRPALTRDWTPRARRLEFEVAPVPGALHLTRTSSRVWRSAPLFVPLGDDLGSGPIEVSVALAGCRAPAFVRFFAYVAHPVDRVRRMTLARSSNP